MEDLTKLSNNLSARLRQQQSGLSAPDRQGITDGSFVESTISAAGEYFLGAEPTKGSAAYRAENPVKGFVSEMLPALAGGSIALKAESAIPKFGQMVDTFASKGSNAVTQGGRRAVAVMAPVEGVRLAGTAIANPDEIGQTVKESLFNLGFEAVGGGILGGIFAGGKVAKGPADELLPVGTDLRSPNQIKVRDLKGKLTEGAIPEDQLTKVRGQISDLEGQIRLEELGRAPDGKYNKLGLNLANDGDAREIERLFHDTDSKSGNIRRSRLVRSTRDFADDVEKDRVIDAAGLRDNFDAVQLPRYVGFAKDQWAKKIEHDLVTRGKMTALDENTLMAKEKSGMHVIAKKITGKIGEPVASDEWVVFRTDQPGRFVPEVKDFADQMAARMAFLRQDNLALNPKKPASIMDQAKLTVSQMPIKEFRDGAAQLGKGAEAGKAMLEKMGLKPGEGGSNFMVNRGKAILDQYLTPRLYQFKNSPVATYVMGNADKSFGQAKFIANKIINGEAVDEGAIKFKKIFGDPDSNGVYNGVRSVKAILDDLDEADIHKMQEVADMVAGTDEPLKLLDELRASGEITEKLHGALKDFDAHDGMIVDDLLNHQSAAGRNDLNPLKGHLMLSRVWEGDYRAPIVNEAGEFLYVASGKTPQLADEIAKKIIDEGKLRGALKVIPAERYDSMQDLQLAGRIATKSKEYGVLSAANSKIRGTPAAFKERQGTGGYKTSFSRKEMLDRVSAHVNERYNYMARISVDTALEKELSWLKEYDPKTFAAVADRLRQAEGKPGAIGQATDMAFDKILKPVMGRNSASKISAVLNESMYHLQLGAMNAAFPALNAITFAQTVLPEAAFVMNAADNRVMRDYYDVFLAGGKDLKPKGNIGVLSPMKLLGKSFKYMGGGGEKDSVYGTLLNRAHREGVIDPQLLNEFIGQSSEIGTKVSDVLKGEEPFVNLLRTWSGWLPSKSERFARGQAFTTGYLMGKDVLGLQDEPLYQFARKFTERTMFNYGTQDRATLMTGPLGRTFGLFKNWQTHYIHAMLQYGDEALRYGNWSPLLWQMGGTASVGGISALPLVAVADKFSQMAGDKSLLEATYSMFGDSDPDSTTGGLSDAVYMGLPAFLGVSLSGNAAAPFSDPARDAAQLMSFPQWDRMRRVGMAVGDAVDTWSATGNHPMESAAVRDKFIAALAPKAIARSMQITENNALTSLNTGNTILKDMSLAERMLWRSGLTPRRVGLGYEAADELWKDQTKRKDMTTKYGRSWMEAQSEGDFDRLEQLRQEAAVLGLDISSITKSANSFKDKRSTEMLERQFSPEARAKLQTLGLPGF